MRKPGAARTPIPNHSPSSALSFPGCVCVLEGGCTLFTPYYQRHTSTSSCSESPPPWSRDLVLHRPRNRQRPWPPSETEGGDGGEYSLPKGKAQSLRHLKEKGERRRGARPPPASALRTADPLRVLTRAAAALLPSRRRRPSPPSSLSTLSAPPFLPRPAFFPTADSEGRAQSPAATSLSK